MERFIDIVLSGLALLFLTPFLLVIVVILRFTGEGEIFFKQERVGKGGEKFSVYKFATMLKDSPNIGTGTVTMKADTRILPFGKFLRKTKINELPQLLNILLGEMSVIGPRPLTLQTFSSYDRQLQEVIIKVRPGLSGIGSIIFRSEEDIMYGEAATLDFYDQTIAPFKGALEAWFVANKGLRVYSKCIVLTIWIIVAPNSQLVWRMFSHLPEPPESLKKPLNFPD
jgi:lipopolysaccharide/colanic/teichoic acid biosynthesis glycosyltransferase